MKQNEMIGCIYVQFYEFDILWKFLVWKMQPKDA